MCFGYRRKGLLMFTQFSSLRTLRFVSSNRKLALSLLSALSLTAILGLSLRMVQSAPSGPESPPIPLLAPPAQPSVMLEVPSEVLIGETITFKVKFDNVGTAVGYGPFVDIVLDAGGANIGKITATNPCSCDGIKFVSAQMVSINGGPLALPASPPAGITTNCANTPSTVSVTHPFAASGVNNVTLPAGSQLVTLALPFGSFEPDQPEIEVEVTAKVSNFADANFPLRIYARGGFRYGLDPLDNPTGPPPDPPILSDDNTTTGTQVGIATLWPNKPTTPTVMILKKTYSGPENETATGPNFPRSYTLTVDIADGQTVSNVVLTDCLPNNMAYDQHLSISPATSLAVVEPAPPGVANNSPASCLVVSWPSLTGGPGPDGVVVFQFFIPKDDANGNLILGPDCKNVLSNNDIRATGQWMPADPCDVTPVTVTSDVTPTDHVLTDKCIAIQKSVPTISTPTGAPGFTPDDVLQYTLSFQISDFKTFGDLVVTDLLSDGQSLTTPAPTLTVVDKFGTTTGSFNSSDLISSTTNVGTTQCPASPGATSLTFKVSQKMINLMPVIPRHSAGILTGGLATTPPVPASTGAIGTIVFFVKIDDVFKNTNLLDPSVDKEDPLGNCVEIKGNSLKNEDPPVSPATIESTASDDSHTAFSIVGDTLEKTVYAVERNNIFICGESAPACSNLPNSPQEVRPGDHVTFRIHKKIPASDAEKLIIQDWLPLPIFNVAEFALNGNSSFTGSFCPIPSPGFSCYRPLTHTMNISTPVFSIPTGTNSIQFDFGSFDDPSNTSRTIDLLFTSTVRNDPFADKLFLTNEVRECEENSFNARFCQIAIAQVNLREPNLRIRKGAIATNNPNGLFSQAVSGPIPNPTPAIATAQAPAGVTFGLTGFTGTISSTNLLGLMNSDLANVDANDIVTFAITIENLGGHSAFDVKLDDIFPASCFTVDPNTIHAQLGSGAVVSPVITGNFSLAFPAPIASLGTTPGDNIVVVTFQAQVKSDITPGCCRNNAKITHYASVSNGPDFVSAGFNPPYEDSAEVCTKPTVAKSVVATSEAHTAPDNSTLGTPQVTIGEIVRYRLEVRLPEGSSPNLRIVDALPAGMKFLNDNSARIAFVSNQVAISHSAIFGAATFLPLSFNRFNNFPTPSAALTLLPPLPSGAITGGSGCGVPVTFDLGNVQNSDNDPDLEYVVIEFNALVCNAAGNQNGTALTNTFSVSVNNTTIATSGPVNVTVVEPNLTITKTVSPTTVIQGVPVTYTVTITNPSLVKAFDVQFADTLPAGLILDPGSVTFAGSCSSPALVNTVPSLTCAEIPVGGVVTITYKALVLPNSCPVTLTNNARVTWTSLPGPNGTISNPTMSSTPGNPGTPDGERDGSNPPLNDYVASASAPLRVVCSPCTKAPPDMVGWWPLDEPNGSTVVNDIAQVNNQGNPTPGLTLGSANAPNAVPGLVNGAVSFPSKTLATGPHINVPDHAEINFGTGDLSIDSWVFVPRPQTAGVYTHPIVDKLQNGPAFAQTRGYAFYLVSSSTGARLEFVMGGGGPPSTYPQPGGQLVPFGQWTHVAVTVKRSTGLVTFYVNGASVVTTDPAMPTGSLTNIVPLLIGEIRLTNSQAAITIDELEMFNRELTLTEVQSIYNAFSAGKCKCPPITLNPPAGALPAGVVNIPYSQTFTATGGCSSSSFTYTVTGGALPPGLTLSANGVLSGTPKLPGVFTFTITATDKCGCSKSQTYTLTVDCPTVPLPLFNTGVADDGSLLAPGAKDLHYKLVTPSPVLPDAIVTQIPSAYLVNGPSSQWIGPDVNPLSNSPGGFYTYQTTFNMPAGADLTTAIIAGQWASDNEAEIFLNGATTGVTIGPNSFAAFTPFVITNNFMAGANTLEFIVRNRLSSSGFTTATGLRVEMSGSVRCCPITKADKCVITTSELHTMPANSNSGTPQVTIGEIIRYRLTTTLAQGASPSFRFTDHLPLGLTYLGNPKVAFVSTGGAGTITSTAFSGAGLNLNASSVGACSGPTPTFILPASQVTGGPFSSGTDPTFNLGNLTNTHNDPNLEYVIVEFNALVNNLPVNAPGLPNQNGATLSNFYDVFVGSQTSAPIATSTPTNVTIVEPHLDVQKTVTTTPGTSQAIFKVTMTNTGTATAFDVQMNDMVPAGLVVLSTPAPSVSVSPASCSQPAVTVNGNTLTLTAPTMPVGCTVTLTFTVDVSSSCPETNIAQVTYTSLPGGSNSTPVGTQPNNTGSVTPGPTGADNGDRVYTASAQASISGVGGGGPCKPSCKCPLKISRFRENGPNGTGDEFVEIFNSGNSDVLVSSCSEDPNGASNGIGVFASAGNGFNPHFGQAANVASLVCQIPGNTIIKGRGYYLCGGKDYSLSALGNNGATSHSVPDQIIGAGNAAASGISDIPNDAGLALLNIGSNIVTQGVIGSLGGCSGFNYSDPGGGGTGDATVFDKVGFRPYGPGSPLNTGPGVYPANIYPSLASQYCEGTCLQPVGDASVVTKGPGVPCPTTITPAPGVSFPVLSGGTISGVRFCYGESGQYEILRRQTTWSAIVGTLHQDTNNNPNDFILLSPDPATGNVGLTISGVSGVTSVLGAAGPYNTIAPPDMLNFTQTFFSALTVNTTVPQPNPVNPENDPLGTVTFRFSYTNNSTKTITGLRFKVDSLSTLCGNQRLIPNSPLSIPANGDARNLLASPNCGAGPNFAILKALNSLTATANANGGPQTFHGTVLEDLSVGPPSPGALSPFAGGVDNSFVLIDDSASSPLGDGVTGGKGKFAITIPPGQTIYVQFRFGKVKTNAPFQLLVTPMATTTP